MGRFTGRCSGAADACGCGALGAGMPCTHWRRILNESTLCHRSHTSLSNELFDVFRCVPGICRWILDFLLLYTGMTHQHEHEQEHQQWRMHQTYELQCNTCDSPGMTGSGG